MLTPVLTRCPVTVVVLFTRAQYPAPRKDGVKNYTEGGRQQWARWLDVYNGLTDVHWLASLGNHDFGDGDKFATCPERRPLVKLGDGQAYSSNQLDPDKGGFRPPGTENYRMPDFSYRYALSHLNLELYAVDQNYR